MTFASLVLDLGSPSWRVLVAALVFFFVMPVPTTFNFDRASATDVASLISVDIDDADTGFTLIAPFSTYKVFLVDGDGVVVHTWTSNRVTTGTVELLPDGTLLRGRAGANRQPDGMHILDWNGKVLWDYTPPSPYKLHHDIEPMPNGNILVNAAVAYNSSSLEALGRDPELVHENLVIEPILEIRPNGATGGDIVWIWDPLDHIVQDFDAARPNYGIVKEHPELLDINYPAEFPDEWQHSNAIAYNPDLDQIMVTNRNFDELWVIDHNTTMTEAAGHTGGAHGMGGDILYRWGNPEAYDRGTSDDHILWGPHDAHWIPPGHPGEGNILVFNNGMNMHESRPEGSYTSIEELTPPLNLAGGYDLAPGSVYGPAGTAWRYAADPPKDFYAWAMGGVERLPRGNTLICGGSTGRIFEVEPDGDIVWSYKTSSAFKASRYYPPYLEPIPSLNATEDTVLTLNLSSLLSDLDTAGEDLSIGCDSTYAEVVGHQLQLLYPEGVLTDGFDLTVSDGIFKVSRPVRVNILPVNDPPALGPVPDVSVVEGVPFRLDVAPYISDPDTPLEELRLAEDSPYVNVAGMVLVFLYPDGVLTDDLVLTVSDGELRDSVGISVSVQPVNDPPTVDSVPDQHGLEDVPWTLDLEGLIRDVDSPIDAISVVSDSSYTTVVGFEVTMLYPENVTRDVVMLTVSDGQGTTVVVFNVTIDPVNDPPAMEQLPAVTAREDEELFLDLAPSITDVDTPVEELSLRVDSPYVQPEGLTLRLLYPDGILQDEVVVEVWDGEVHSVSILRVIVEPVNDPPSFRDLGPVTVTEDTPFELDLGPLIYDTDSPSEVLTIRVDSAFVAVEGKTLVLLYLDGVGRDEVVVELSDGELFARATLVVNVVPVNDPPWWSDLPEILAIEDVETALDLEQFMNDPDTPVPDLFVEVVSNYGSMEGHVFRFTYPDGVLSEQVTFTLSDGEFRVVLTTKVVVQPINDAPELTSPSVDPPGGRAGASFRFTVIFRDVDMGPNDPLVEVVIDGIAHTCSRSDEDGSPYDGGVLFLLETKLTAGAHTFYFSAIDGDGGSALDVAQDGGGGDGSGPAPIVVGIAIATVVLAVVLLLTFGRRSSDGKSIS